MADETVAIQNNHQLLTQNILFQIQIQRPETSTGASPVEVQRQINDPLGLIDLILSNQSNLSVMSIARLYTRLPVPSLGAGLGVGCRPRNQAHR